MTVLSLDLATKTGWAFYDENQKVTHGTEDFGVKRLDTKGLRYCNFHDWLAEKLKNTDVVFYEEVMRHMSCHSAHFYGGLEAILLMLCCGKGIDAYSVPIGTIKKNITGKGTATKLDVINAVEKLGFKPKDDNDADALALLHCVIKSNLSTHKNQMA